MRKFFVAVLLIAVATAVQPQAASAEGNASRYHYYDVTIQLHIQTDGSAVVHEDIVCDEISDSDGLIVREIDISDVSDINAIEVSVVRDGNNLQPLMASDVLEGLSSEQFYLEKSTEHPLKASVYIPCSQNLDAMGRLRYQLTYTVTDLIWLYNDTAFLEWPLMTNDRSRVLRNFVCELEFPASMEDSVSAYINGALFLNLQSVSETKLQFISTHIPPKTAVSCSAIMPVSFFPDARKRIDTDRKAEIIAIQNQINIEKTEKESDYQKNTSLKSILSASPLAILVIATMIIYFLFGRPINFKKSSQYEGKIPVYHSPAELAYQSYHRVCFMDVYTTLLDLSARSIIKMKNLGGEMIFISENNDALHHIKRHERYLVNWIFNAHATETISFSRIFSILDRDGTAYKNARFKTFARSVRKQTGRLVAGKPNRIARFIGIVISAVCVVMSCALIYFFDSMLWANAIIFCSVLFCAYAFSLRRYDEEETKHWLEWKGLLKFFRHMRRKKDLGFSVTDWERLFAYSIALKQSKPIASKIKAMLKTEKELSEERMFKDVEDVELALRLMHKVKRKHD